MNQIRPLLTWARTQLEQHLTDTTRASTENTARTFGLDAELLMTQVLACSRSFLYAHGESTLTVEQIERYQELVTRRCLGIPIAYLLGRREFYGLDLEVSPAALVPRPETELLVDTALELIPPNASWQIADLGTGSGAIALALAKERPYCQLIATDRSAGALALAQRNARRLQVSNIEFRQGNWLQPIKERLPLIVSNPPYVAASDQRLQADSLRHEPLAALTPGEDGLGAIRHIISGASKQLFNNGWLILEHGYDQASAVRGLFAQCGFESEQSRCDLAGHERITLAKKNTGSKMA